MKSKGTVGLFMVKSCMVESTYSVPGFADASTRI